MPALPRLSGWETVRAFESLGWEVVRQKGSHIILIKCENHLRPRRSSAVHRGRAGGHSAAADRLGAARLPFDNPSASSGEHSGQASATWSR